MNPSHPIVLNNVAAEPCIACYGRNWIHDLATSQVVRSQFPQARVLRCKRCGHGVLNPYPSIEAVQAIYASSDYIDAYLDSGEQYVLDQTQAAAILKPRFERLHHYKPSRGRILDIGAARGVFLSHARDHGWEVVGVEASPDAIAHAKSQLQIEIELGTLESLDLPSASFDCIHISHVLEHLWDPVAAIEKMHRLLKPSGIVVLEVPFEFGTLFEFVQHRLLGVPRQINSVPSTHLHFFTIESISSILVDRGFHILRSQTHRRNQDENSRLPMGKLLKRCVYQWESWTKLGPNIEIFAQRL